jgi:predicted HD phosphohydrolase
MNFIDQLDLLFAQHGSSSYEGLRREPVTALQHALQCAQLAEWANASPALVAAALLHDIGQFIPAAATADALDDEHEMRALPLLSQGLGAAVAEPVRLHVQAKRYLVTHEPRHVYLLSPASVRSLALQGGPMGEEESHWFETLPYAMDAVALRRWDDHAKEPGKKTPPWAYYRDFLEELVARHNGQPERTLVAALEG